MTAPSAAPSSLTSLRGLNRWLTAPSLFGGLIGGTLAGLYGYANVELVVGTRLWFAGFILVTVLGASWVGDAVEQAGLQTLRRLGEGTLPPSRDNLLRAVREAFGLPNRSLLVNVFFWLGGALVVAILYRLVPGVGWSVPLRLVYLGLAVGALTSMGSYYLLLARSRAVVERVTAVGLPLADVSDALSGKRRLLRRRLVAFTAIAVISPSLFIADMVLARADANLERLLAADEAGQALIVKQSSVPVGPAGLAMAGMVAAMTIWIAYLIGGALSRPLRAISEEASRVARGDLVAPRLILAEDEVWVASTAFTQMEAQLAQAITDMKGAGVRINTTTEQLFQGSIAQRGGAAEQTTALNETSATTEELARSAAQIAGNAREVAELAERTLLAAQTARRNAEAFFASMRRMRDDNQRIADSVLKLNKRVQQIGRIVVFINEIGDKSDLLALNAELEGTKAGEVGRGFSLVAAEMRRLAETVIRSTHEIAQLIEEIRDGTNAAVMATESGLKAMDAGTATAGQVMHSLESILEEAARTSAAVHAISLATRQQETGTDQLATAMAEILRITQESGEATEEIGRSNAELSDLAGDLKGVVDNFRLSETGEGTRHG